MRLLQLFIFALLLTDLITGRQHPRKQQRQKRDSCHGGCLTCSDFNGCLTCKARLFFHLEQSGMSEFGVCLPFCPRGYYGNRSPHVSRCIKCGEECASCFSRGFCTRCRSGQYLLRGKCIDQCPGGLYPNDTHRECRECSAGCAVCGSVEACVRCEAGLYWLGGLCHPACPEGLESDPQKQECIPTVDCDVAEWAEWTACSRRGRVCGFRRGNETRTRDVLQSPSPLGNPCPVTMETRHCLTKKMKCQGL